MSSTARALLLTRDPKLLAEVQRLAAAAGAEVTAVAEPEEARSSWQTAAVVLVGPDALPALATLAPGRRDRVHVVAAANGLADALFRDALEVGAESVVELPAAETWLVETLADTLDGTAGDAQVVGVVGGCGGAGATTFATALATAASDERGASGGRSVILVDTDPLGPGIERVSGIDDTEGARWAPLLQSAGRLGSRSLRASLPRRDELAVLGWGPGSRVPLQPQVVREVLSAAARGSALVVVDLPRYADAATVEALHRCDRLVVVTRLELSAVASAARLVTELLPAAPQSHLVARGSASGLDPGEVADALGLPLVAVMSDQRRLAESVDLGLGPLRGRRGPLARAVRETLTALAEPATAVRPDMAGTACDE